MWSRMKKLTVVFISVMILSGCSLFGDKKQEPLKFEETECHVIDLLKLVEPEPILVELMESYKIDFTVEEKSDGSKVVVMTVTEFEKLTHLLFELQNTILIQKKDYDALRELIRKNQ